MNTQFKKGILEMCILNLINTRDMYGFEVIETLSNQLEVTENTVYPILRRLTAQGLFKTYLQKTSIGAPRKYYKPTDSGKTKLDNYQKNWTTFLTSVSKLMGGYKNET